MPVAKFKMNLNKGYLLIELMVALVLLSIMGIGAGKLLGLMSSFEKRAHFYLKATTAAQSVIEGSGREQSLHDGLQIEVQTSQPNKELPFMLSIVTVQDAAANGEQKTIRLIGGRLQKDA